MIMSMSTAKRFKYTVYHKIVIHADERSRPSLGDIIEPLSKRWWKNMDGGHVIELATLSSGSIKIIVKN